MMGDVNMLLRLFFHVFQVVSRNNKYLAAIGLLLIFGSLGLLRSDLSLFQNPVGGSALEEERGRFEKTHHSVVKEDARYGLVFDERRHRVETVCKELFPHERLPDKETLLSQTVPFNRNLSEKLLVNEDLKLIWCRVPKASGTYWRNAFAQMQLDQLLAQGFAYEEAEPRIVEEWPELRNYPPEKALQMLEDYKKVMWVRSPHFRLISAYRNKIMKPTWKNPRFNGTRMEIRANLRPPNATEADGEVTIEEFFKYLKAMADANGRETFNVHWRPYFAVCDVCKLPWLKFDYIGKTENIVAEGPYIKRQIAPNQIVHPVPERKPQTSPAVVKRVFSLVAPSLARQVLDFYREDYLLFQYDSLVL